MVKTSLEEFAKIVKTAMKIVIVFAIQGDLMLEYKIEKPKKTVYFIVKNSIVAEMSIKKAVDFGLQLLNDIDKIKTIRSE